MATIINLQGFPKVASEAIEFSYFLSESEKVEWREWLKTATPEQQEELVDILYSMWQDNQKNAVPENLANNSNLNSPTPPVSNPTFPVQNNVSTNTPSPISNPQIQQPRFSQTYNQAPNLIPEPPAVPSFNPQATAPIQPIPSFIPEPQSTFVAQTDFNPQPQTSQEPEIIQVQPKPEITIPTLTPQSVVEPKVQQTAIAESIDRIQDETVEADFDTEFKNSDNFAEVETRKAPEINMESLVNDNKYTPNPILTNNQDSDESNFIFKNNIDPAFVEKPNSKKSNSTQKTIIGRNDTKDTKERFDFRAKSNNNNRANRNNQGNTNKSNNQDQVVEFSSLKNPGSKDVLNEIYNDYIETYDTNQKKFLVFLEKVTKVLSNYETISEHFENLTGKVIEINDKMVNQAQDIQALKDATKTQSGTSIQDQIDDLRFDSDNMEKDLRSLRTESRRKTSEISQQMAAVGANSYQDGGIGQKIELLKSEIQGLKQQVASNPQNQISGTNQMPVKTSKLDLTGII